MRERLPEGPLSLTNAEGPQGYVYVAGRLAAIIERYHIVWNRVTFAVVPASVDAFFAQSGPISHVALSWRGTCCVYRAEGGVLQDGTAFIQVPSVFKLPSPECPGLRLPMV